MSASVAFLRQRLAASQSSFAPGSPSQPLPAEVVTTFLTCLNTTHVSTSVPPSLANEIVQIVAAWRQYQLKAGAAGVVPGVGGVPPTGGGPPLLTSQRSVPSQGAGGTGFGFDSSAPGATGGPPTMQSGHR